MEPAPALWFVCRMSPFLLLWAEMVMAESDEVERGMTEPDQVKLVVVRSQALQACKRLRSHPAWIRRLSMLLKQVAASSFVMERLILSAPRVRSYMPKKGCGWEGWVLLFLCLPILTRWHWSRRHSLGPGDNFEVRLGTMDTIDMPGIDAHLM